MPTPERRDVAALLPVARRGGDAFGQVSQDIAD
jgi:hypothetical protein